MTLLLTFILSILGGVLGRMGGSGEYDTKWRDLGIPLLCFLPLTTLMFGVGVWRFSLLYVPAMWLALSTYWDGLFGYDNLWFSGLGVGVSVFPIPIYTHRWVGFFIRSLTLAVVWRCLNEHLPGKVWVWRRDVVEEFLRYFTTVVTLPLLVV